MHKQLEYQHHPVALQQLIGKTDSLGSGPHHPVYCLHFQISISTLLKCCIFHDLKGIQSDTHSRKSQVATAYKIRISRKCTSVSNS